MAVTAHGFEIPVDVEVAGPVVVRFAPPLAAGSVPRPFVFLDKDGTLIEDLPYNVDPRRVRFAPGAREAVRMLGDAGLPLVVCSNQSGVARGYYTIDELRRLARHLHDEVARLGGELAALYACPHLPTGINAWALVCDCRKPAAAMLTLAAEDLGADLPGSWMIGDTWMDVAAGRAAGCRAILVGPEWRTAASLPASRRPTDAVPDLLSAARIVVAGLATPAAESPEAVAAR
ncbi:MAG TPA: HAD family hydrolase [Candidatus Limnocylindrales bacterium]|nr:HAD family hydrolase [Candidatus Limnocylindrales bacterium]